MIYMIEDGTFFGELDNSTAGSATQWGMLFDKNEFMPCVRKDEWVSTPADKERTAVAREILAKHIRGINSVHDRLNEVFNLISANSSPGVIEKAYARGTQVFLSEVRQPKASEIYLLVSTVDREFAHLENLVTAEPLILPNKYVHQIDNTFVGAQVCHYVTGQLALMERLQAIVRGSRRDDESA